jgi:hypothetical protein
MVIEVLFAFNSTFPSIPSPFSDFCSPEVVEDASTTLDDSKDSLDGSNFPSLLPDDPFSEFGFRPFLPFLEDEEEDETTEDESPPPRSPLPSVTLMLGALPTKEEFRPEVEHVNAAEVLLMDLVVEGLEVLLTNSESRFSLL